MNLKRGIICLGTCAAMIFSAGVYGSLKNVNTARADTISKVSYQFDSEEELNDFSTYYAESENSTNGTAEDFNAHFRYDAQNHAVISKKTAAGNGSTGNVASLTLTKYKFKNFEAKVKMNFSGDSSWGWGGLQFRQNQVLSGWRADGCFAFAQKEGKSTIWGADDFDDTTIESESSGSFSSQTPFTLYVRVVNKDVTVKVMSEDESRVFTEKSYTFLKESCLKDGYISLRSVDNSHAFYSLSIINLDDFGNESPLTQQPKVTALEFTNEAKQISLFNPTELSVNITPSIMTVTDLLWSSSNTEILIVKDGVVTGLKTGTATVTATAISNSLVSATIEIEVTNGKSKGLVYSFSDVNAKNNFNATFVANATDTSGGIRPFEDYWQETADGTIIRNNITAVAESDEHFAGMYIKDRLFTNFEATLTYRNVTGGYGWIGITSGTTALNQRFIDNGQGYFMQREGKATLWGSATGGPYEQSISGYSMSDWHILKVKAVGAKVEMFVDDLLTPAFTKTLGHKTQEGYLGFVATGRAQYEVRDFAVNYLTDNGEIIDFTAIKTFDFKNKISNAKVGDSIKLELNIEPIIEGFSYSVSTTNNNLCFVKGGTMYFIGEGVVTVTIASNFDSEMTKSMTIVITDERDSSHDYYYPEDEDVSSSSGGTTKIGCGTINLSTILALISLTFISLAALRRIK